MNTLSDAQAWTAEAVPVQLRLAAIRAAAERVTPSAVPQCMPAMLRDLQAAYDWQIEQARVQRSEILCEVGELLLAVGFPQASDLINAQILLEHVDHGAAGPLGRELRARILAGLARNPAVPDAPAVADPES